MSNFNIPYAKNEDFPSHNDVIMGIAKIEKELLNKDFDFNYESLKKIFLDNLMMIPLMMMPNFNHKQLLYRVRSIGDDEIDLIHLPQTFSHPPKDSESCRLGRANLKGFPVLYCSLQVMTALNEFRENGLPIKENQEIYVSIWELKPEAKINICQYLFPEDITGDEQFKQLNQINLTKFKNTSRPYTADVQNAVLNLSNFIARKFISNDYKISSFISHYHLYDFSGGMPIEPDAIFYPSVANGHTGINAAFHPNTVKTKLSLIEVQKLSFKEFRNGGVAHSPLSLGIPDLQNEEIIWKNLDVNLKEAVLAETKFIFHQSLPNIDRTGIKFFLEDKEVDIEDVLITFLVGEGQDDLVKEMSQITSEGILNKEFEKEISVFFKENHMYALLKDNRYFLKEAVCKIRYPIS